MPVGSATTTQVTIPVPPSADSAIGKEANESGFWGEDGFSFKDILDVINPLQHLPVVGSIYRAITGDAPSGGARVIGDALFGGPLGLISGLFNALFSEHTGKDMGEHAIAAVTGGDKVQEVADADASTTYMMRLAKNKGADAVLEAVAMKDNPATFAEDGSIMQPLPRFFASAESPLPPQTNSQPMLASSANRDQEISKVLSEFSPGSTSKEKNPAHRQAFDELDGEIRGTLYNMHEKYQAAQKLSALSPSSLNLSM